MSLKPEKHAPHADPESSWDSIGIVTTADSATPPSRWTPKPSRRTKKSSRRRKLLSRPKPRPKPRKLLIRLLLVRVKRTPRKAKRNDVILLSYLTSRTLTRVLLSSPIYTPINIHKITNPCYPYGSPSPHFLQPISALQAQITSNILAKCQRKGFPDAN